jgi:hypothetical protein
LRIDVSKGLKPRAQGFAQTFRTNSFPGNRFSSRFNSKPSKATLTAISLLIDDAEIS